jgi:hypothetical protein
MTNSSREVDLLRAVDLIETHLTDAHKIAQRHEGDPLADSIHAIVHRRERDFSNSLYWWRRVGDGLDSRLAGVYPNSDPGSFVRAVESLSLSDEEISRIEAAELIALRSILASD